jgi:raffinose/stachyose/melibiose transport system permease protein
MKKQNIWTYVASAIIFIYCGFTLILLLGVIGNSFKPAGEILSGDIWRLPRSFSIDGYIRLLFGESFLLYIRNSIIIMVVTVVCSMYISALASFGLAKFRFKGQQFLQTYFLLGMIFPGTMAIVPLYVLIRQLGLINKLLSIILIQTAGVSLPILIFTGFIKKLPNSLIEAAQIEGAKTITIFHHIILPLLMPVIGSLAPLSAVGSWNNYLIPMMFLNSKSVRTLPIGLALFNLGFGTDLSKINLIFASAGIAILPILIVYLVFSGRIIEGITAGAIKE